MKEDNTHDARTLLFECKGAAIGEYLLRAFCLHGGESLCIHLAAPSPWWQDHLVPVLTGRIPCPEVTLHGSVAYLSRPRARRRWWGPLYDPSASTWLTTDEGLQADQASRILQARGIRPGTAIGELGWNERTLLALDAWLLRPTQVLVFDTAGNDPQGEEAVMRSLAGRPAISALIYLKTSASSLCLPGTCIAVAHRELQATAGVTP